MRDQELGNTMLFIVACFYRLFVDSMENLGEVLQWEVDPAVNPLTARPNSFHSGQLCLEPERLDTYPTARGVDSSTCVQKRQQP